MQTAIRLLRELRTSVAPGIGLYEVEDYAVSLTLCDSRGREARLSKIQRVRFLQDNSIAFQDQAWGDGDFLLDYRCAPGKAVDFYQDGFRTRILISLREVKNRGDELVFLSERRIRNGFRGSEEYLQVQIDHVTRIMHLSVIFPKERPPLQVTLVEENAHRSRELPASAVRIRPDGQIEASWTQRNPRLFEGYMLRWTW
ncbi:MAG: hypothetical protein IPK19_31220 [Chloroflexi bacterium]|nr:hypothetical protein [Chloroflexota bacterium]